MARRSGRSSSLVVKADYMKAIITLLVSSAMTVLSLPSSAAEYGSEAPEAVLTPIALAETRSQTARVIYSTWKGEEFDRSRPPIHWPRPLQVSNEVAFRLELATQDQPLTAEVRAWRALRPNGKPRGKPETSECGRLTSPTVRDCTLVPVVTSNGLHWQIHFDLERSTGPYYIAVSAVWEDAQVAWINSVKLNG